MSTYKTEGIIIKRNNFLESGLILNIYTRDYGKIEAVARSARKAKGKLKGHLELFLWTEIILAHGKNIDTITSSLTIKSFSSLRNNLKLSFAAYYILELVDKITAEEYQDERIFYLLKRSLLFLDELAICVVETRHCLVSTTIILLFQINILDLTGFSPELNNCVFCEKPIKPDKNYFSFSMGGVVGKECILQKSSKSLVGRYEPSFTSETSASEGLHLPNVLISDNAIKLLRLLQFKGNNTEEYNEHLDKCFKIIRKLKTNQKLVSDSVFLMNKFIEFNIERKIKGFDFLENM